MHYKYTYMIVQVQIQIHYAIDWSVGVGYKYSRSATPNHNCIEIVLWRHTDAPSRALLPALNRYVDLAIIEGAMIREDRYAHVLAVTVTDQYSHIYYINYKWVDLAIHNTCIACV